jgi:CPA1 family monovalent cation:H+ antiporter
MDEGLRQIIAMLSVAMAVAMVARRVKLPYTVGLVLVGALLAFSRTPFGPDLTPELIFDLILPPLLFEAALALHWRDLRRDLLPILVLSSLGTVIAMAIIATGMIFLLHWPAPSALVFGALISATDPVAIIAMFKDNKLKGRLCLLVESESLFNDGAAAVLFALALAWATASDHAPSAMDMSMTLVRMVAGGIGVGAGVGGAAILFARGTSEHLVEVTLTTIAAFASFLVAERLHVSGVLATVTAGLIMGNLGVLGSRGKIFISPRGREAVTTFWEFAAFLANSVVFLLIGANVANMPYRFYGTEVLAGAIAMVLVGRALTVYPLSLAFRGSRWAISAAEQHVLWWGGLRGALGLALALSLPSELPLRNEIVVVTFGVVAFSIIAQGLTMPLLLRWLGFLPARS